MRSFEDLIDDIKKCPETYIPALLKAVIETAIKKKVFVFGGLGKFIAFVEKELQKKLDE